MARRNRMAPRIRRALLASLLAIAVAACAAAPPELEPEAPRSPARGQVVRFSYPTLDGQTLSTTTLSGRFTVLGFITTYDHFSHAQARFLSTLVNRYVPRINAGLIILEPPQNRVLMEAFQNVVAPPYPIAMADEATIRGEGPFEDVREVPTVVILDQLGREGWRHKGLASNDMIAAALNALRQGKTPP